MKGPLVLTQLIAILQKHMGTPVAETRVRIVVDNKIHTVPITDVFFGTEEDAHGEWPVVYIGNDGGAKK